jgi:hypothetical protein
MEQSADMGGQLPLVQSGSLARILMLPARPIAGSNDCCDRKSRKLEPRAARLAGFARFVRNTDRRRVLLVLAPELGTYAW